MARFTVPPDLVRKYFAGRQWTLGHFNESLDRVTHPGKPEQYMLIPKDFGGNWEEYNMRVKIIVRNLCGIEDRLPFAIVNDMYGGVPMPFGVEDLVNELVAK